jgi:hypothetical protein
MHGMLHAAPAIFLPLELIRRIFFILQGRIILAFAFGALEKKYIPHRVTPILR